MPLQSLAIKARSATTLPSPEIRRTAEVAKLIDTSRCIGCKACQIACMEWNDVRDKIGTVDGTYDNPIDLSADSWTVMRYYEQQGSDPYDFEWLIRKDGCMHCADPGCLKACPAPGAIVQYSNGIVDFHEENCIGCGYCIPGCPFNIPRLSKKDHKAYKCTLGSDRVAVGLEPACVKTCPTGAIMFGSKDQMHAQAAGRVDELKGRGFADAGLYDPQGVGGTHVMYVLKHADKPAEIGLPDKPGISPLVSIWKGATKPLANIVLAGLALGGFIHYVTQGPNEVSEEEEEKEEENDPQSK